MAQIYKNFFIRNLSKNFKIITDLVNELSRTNYQNNSFVDLKILVNAIFNSPLVELLKPVKEATEEDNFVPWTAYENFASISEKVNEALKKYAEEINNFAQEISQKDRSNFSDWSEATKQEFLSKISDEQILKIRAEFEVLKEILKDPKINQLVSNGLYKDHEIFSLKLQNRKKDEQISTLRTQSTELKQQKAELNVSEDWHEHFEARAKEIRKEIRLLNKTSVIFWKLRIPGKVALLRLGIYLAPVVSAAIALYTLFMANYKEFSFQHYEFAASMILLVSILSYHLKHVLRELNILKHMHSSYLHRAIVAKTFQSLVASDHFKGEKSEIVVKEAALAMFKKEAQGYLSKDQMEPSNTPLQEIVGIFKNK